MGSHLRIADNEIWVIVLDDFQPAGDFARVLHEDTQTGLVFITGSMFLPTPPCQWILSDLADFDHIQLLLESSQHGVIVASGALGDGAPFL